jgi:hypothetical protein
VRGLHLADRRRGFFMADRRRGRGFYLADMKRGEKVLSSRQEVREMVLPG